MEEWKDIPGYEGIYQASNLGRIRSAYLKVTSSKRFPHRVWQQRILKQKKAQRKRCGLKSNCDCRVTLWKDGVEKTHLVSRLVAMAWCDGYAEGLQVNHKDGNPMNNEATNLEWVTAKENTNHAFDNGLIRTGVKCKVKIGNDWVEYRSMSKASEALGHTSGYISLMLSKGKTVENVIVERVV